MFKKGQRVVKIISGFGTETASIQTVCKVDKRKGFVYTDPDDICDDGQNTYRLDDGRAAFCWITGFSHRIIILED